MKGRQSRNDVHGNAGRARICQEAARIMAEEGVRDFQAAKRRAAARLGLPEGKHLPANQEIEAALAQYLELFHGREMPPRRARLRGLACEAMRFFARFEPRLVGAALSGVVTADAVVELHLTADTPEEVGLLLDEHRIPFEQLDRRLRFGGEREVRLPAYRFIADGTTVEAIVLSPLLARETPLSPVDGKPMRRAPLREIEMLLEQPPA